MKKGFVVFPLIFFLTIVFCSGGAAYFVAQDLTDTTIVSPIADFGNFESIDDRSSDNVPISPIPYVDSNNSQKASIENLPELIVIGGHVSSGTEPLTPSLGVQLDFDDVNLESVLPESGKTGELITLKGSGFGESFGVVFFKSSVNDSCCAVQADSWSDGEIKVEVFAVGIKGKLNVAVETASGKLSNYLDFNVTSGLPVIERVEPNEVEAGQFVVIYGEEFGDSLGQVNFYESEGTAIGRCVFGAGFVWNNAQITCIIPEELLPGEYNIEVITADGKESDIKEIVVN